VSFLDHARSRLEEHLPGLDKELADVGLMELEQPGSGALSMFRAAGGPGLLVPGDYQGLGASLVDAVHVQRAIGARSPSLAIATAMHHFSVASLVELAARNDGMEWAMLEAIATNRWLLSSAFAEGRSGAHILSPTMRGEPVGDGLRVNGSKKPCSLTWSMDLLSASVAVPGDDGVDHLAVILVPASTPGIERRPFWQTAVLAAAESDEVVLHDVHVPEALVYRPTPGVAMDPVHVRGLTSFNLLIAASYVGIASGLAERVLHAERAGATERALLAVELESATGALAHVAATVDAGGDLEADLSQALYARYAAERAVERAAMAAAALTGGMAFIGSGEIAYLLAASRALAFHPPSFGSAAGSLAAHLAGAELVL